MSSAASAAVCDTMHASAVWRSSPSFTLHVPNPNMPMLTHTEAYAEPDHVGMHRLMGFGHRVYKTYDPRAKIMKQVCDQVLEHVGVK